MARLKSDYLMVMGVSIVFGLLFWIVDGYFEYLFFHKNLRFLLLEGPETLAESLFTKVPLHSLFVRMSFIAATCLGGVLLSLFLHRKNLLQQKLRHLNSVLMAIRNVNQLIVKENDPERLITEACENLTATMGYGYAWITLLDEDCHTVTKSASAGEASGLGIVQERVLSGGTFPGCMEKTLNQKAMVVVRNPASECPACPLAAGNGGWSGVSQPLAFQGRIFGVLTVSAPTALADDPQEKALITEMAGDLAFALHKIEVLAERNSAIEDLERSRENYRRIFENVQDVYYETSIDGTILEISPSIEIVSRGQYRKADLMGTSMLSYYPDPKERDKLISALIESGRVADFEISLQNRDGSQVLCSISSKLLRDAQGSPLKIIGSMRDITDRKQAEERLRESEERFRNLVEHANAGLWVIDTAGATTYVNQRMAAMLGCATEEMRERSLFDFVDEGDHEVASRNLERRRQGIAEVHEFEFIRRDGTRISTLLSTNPLMDPEGACIGALAIVTDITTFKQAEQEREKLQSQLIQAQKMESVGRLAGGVAHDFNNMLSVIIGVTELALEKTAPEDRLHEDLTEVLAAARRSTDITRQLLAFARRQTIDPQVIDLNETVESMLKMLRRLIGEDIDLSWQPGPGRMPVFMDPSQLDQLLANLCVNARDAIADVGRLTIETGRARFDADYCADHAGFVPGDFILLAVSDDGCGMDKETLANIFEPFFTTKGVGRGTGLGLSTVFGIVKQNDGFINVYSEPGKGTTFRIYLPPHAGEEAEVKAQETDDIPVGHGESVLVVEDEAPVLKLAQRILGNLGYTVLTAATPGEAMALAEAHAGEIHLLITDVVMPEMNGRELAGNLQARYPDLKVLFMSGYTADVIAHRGVLDEGVHFVQKPFSKQGLAASVRSVLDDQHPLP